MLSTSLSPTVDMGIVPMSDASVIRRFTVQNGAAFPIEVALLSSLQGQYLPPRYVGGSTIVRPGHAPNLYFQTVPDDAGPEDDASVFNPSFFSLGMVESITLAAHESKGTSLETSGRSTGLVAVLPHRPHPTPLPRPRFQTRLQCTDGAYVYGLVLFSVAHHRPIVGVSSRHRTRCLN